MIDRVFRFSRLLRIFELNGRHAYIIEMEDNKSLSFFEYPLGYLINDFFKKTLYISYCDIDANKVVRHQFKSYKEVSFKLKKEFKNLSDHCLMSQCINAEYMFFSSNITHFEADCSSLIYADSMFRKTNIKEININFPKLKIAEYMFFNSSLTSIKSEFPLLENGNYIFNSSKIKEMNINFPSLKNGQYMFSESCIQEITSQFPLLINSIFMFAHTPLKYINCQFPSLKHKDGMFFKTPPKLKQNYPHYFI